MIGVFQVSPIDWAASPLWGEANEVWGKLRKGFSFFAYLSVFCLRYLWNASAGVLTVGLVLLSGLSSSHTPWFWVNQCRGQAEKIIPFSSYFFESTSRSVLHFNTKGCILLLFKSLSNSLFWLKNKIKWLVKAPPISMSRELPLLSIPHSRL